MTFVIIVTLARAVPLPRRPNRAIAATIRHFNVGRIPQSQLGGAAGVFGQGASSFKVSHMPQCSQARFTADMGAFPSCIGRAARVHR